MPFAGSSANRVALLGGSSQKKRIKLMKYQTTLTSLIAAIGATRAIRSLFNFELSDVMHSVGLERRRNHTLENIGLVALGTAFRNRNTGKAQSTDR